MIQFQIRVMCCMNPDNTCEELDRAVAALNGQREIVLGYPSWWDSWFFSDDAATYVSLFLSRPQDIYYPHPIRST
jgi:hypothetical protein